MGHSIDIDSDAGGLSHITNQYHFSVHSNIDGNSDPHPAHADCYANPNAYADTNTNIHPGTSWLPEAAGGLYACRGQ